MAGNGEMLELRSDASCNKARIKIFYTCKTVVFIYLLQLQRSVHFLYSLSGWYNSSAFVVSTNTEEPSSLQRKPIKTWTKSEKDCRGNNAECTFTGSLAGKKTGHGKLSISLTVCLLSLHWLATKWRRLSTQLNLFICLFIYSRSICESVLGKVWQTPVKMVAISN